MYEARIANDDNRLVDAINYTKNRHDELCCADPSCGAGMVAVRESTELGSITRAAHFRTQRGDTHKDGCTAHAEEKHFTKSVKSIKEALKKGHTVIFSLNDLDSNYGMPKSMGQTFNSRSDAAYKETELYKFEQENCGRYISQSIQKIRTLQTLLQTIAIDHGPEAFRQVKFAWQGQIKSYDEFLCDDMDKAHEISRQLYGEAGHKQNPYRFDYKGHIGVYGFPRMVQFQLLSVGTDKNAHMVFGDEKIVSDDGQGATITLRQAIDTRKLDADTKARLLDGEPIWIIATPKVNRTMVDSAVKNMRQGQSSAIWLALNVNGDAQMAPVHKQVVSCRTVHPHMALRKIA
jgi:hypothetical protein